MSTQYAKPIPFDRNGIPLVDYPPAASAIGTTVRENASASSVTSLTANTTAIEVGAIGTGAAIRWAVNQATSVITAAGTANFDNFVPVNTVRKFVVPRRVQAIPNYQNAGAPSIVGLNTAEGLFANIATISAGIGSVLLTEY